MKDSPNIYKAARQTAHLTIEQAAERLHCSETCVKDYESGARVPAVCVVEQMCDAYDATILAYRHIRLLCEGVQVVPDVRERDLQDAAIRLVNRVLEFADEHRELQLLRIAEDGVISAEERPLFETILAELDELVRASTEIRLAREHREE